MFKEIFDLIRGFLILIGFYFISQFIIKLLHLVFPPAILGLILFAIALTLGIIKEEWIAKTSNLLIKYMAMFLVPFVCGLVVYKSLLLNNWLIILLVIFITTTLVIAVIGLFVEYGLKFYELRKSK